MDETRQRTLAAVAARILPSDDGVGAVEAGVPAFLEEALRHRMYAILRAPFESWLDELRSQALEKHGQELDACTPRQQDALLRAAQQSPDAVRRLLFDTLVTLTLEGFLADPVHGGNRDFLGWRFIGYEDEEPRSGFCAKERARP